MLQQKSLNLLTKIKLKQLMIILIFKSSRNIAKKYNKKFDVITANNVFGHNPDLDSFAKGVKNLMTDESIFVTEISYSPTILKKKLFFRYSIS